MSRIGPYEVVRELGRGGMGVVYAVRDPELPRLLALKLQLDAEASPESVARFRREVEALARVRHPSVLAVHHVGRASQGTYVVTDLVEGQTLEALLRRGPPEPVEAARIVAALARAVAAVHAAGVLHRDLKPDNVLLRADGSPVLLDFGLARDEAADRLTRTGEVLGTPAFMSPEQADGDGRGLDERTDVYGLGAVLFALLAGRPPFAGGPMQAVRAVLVDEPRWPSADRPAVPRALEAVCRAAMAKEPDQRYSDAASLAADLERFLSGEEPAASPPTRARRALAPLALGLSAIVAVALVIAAVGGGRGGSGGGRAETDDALDAATSRPEQPAAARQQTPNPTSSPGAATAPQPARPERDDPPDPPQRAEASDALEDERGGRFLSDEVLVTWRGERVRRWTLAFEGEELVVEALGAPQPVGFRVSTLLPVEGVGVLVGGEGGQLAWAFPAREGEALPAPAATELAGVRALSAADGRVAVGGPLPGEDHAVFLLDVAKAQPQPDPVWRSSTELKDVLLRPGGTLVVGRGTVADIRRDDTSLQLDGCDVIQLEGLEERSRAEFPTTGCPLALRDAGERAYLVGTVSGALYRCAGAEKQQVSRDLTASLELLPIRGIALSPDARWVYVGFGAYHSALGPPNQGHLDVWSLDERRNHHEGERGLLPAITRLDSTPDGLLLLLTLASSEDGRHVELWYAS